MNCSLCGKPINDKIYWNHFATHTKNLQEYKQRFLSGETNLAEIAIQSWAMETINASNIMQENMWKDMDNMKLQLHKEEMDYCKQCGQQLDSQTVAIHYKTHLDSLEKDMAHYYNKQNKNKKAHRSHPEQRKRSECGEELDYNKIYMQDNIFYSQWSS